MQSQTVVAVTKAPKPSAPQPTGTIMPPLKKQQPQQQSVISNNNILNGTKLVKNSKKVSSNNVKNNLNNNNNKSDIKNHNTTGVINKIIINGHSNNGSSCSGGSEGSSSIMVTPPSDVRGKKILKEAVDAVVNSFAKHTQGYGRGELIYCIFYNKKTVAIKNGQSNVESAVKADSVTITIFSFMYYCEEKNLKLVGLQRAITEQTLGSICCSVL